MSLGKLILGADPWFVGLAVGLTLLLTGWMGWRVMHTPPLRRRGFRLTVSILALLALMGMALQPGWQASGPAAVAVLVTKQAPDEQVRRVVDSLGARGNVYTLLENSSPVPAGLEIKQVADIAALSRSYPAIADLHVLGEGLPAYEWGRSHPYRITLHPSPPSQGILFVHSPRRGEVGQPFRLEGQLLLERPVTSEHPAHLVLEGPGGRVDSVAIEEPGMHAFSLHEVPREAGRFLYQVVLINERDTLFREETGVLIEQTPPPRLLILEGAPGFETRSLKVWLAAQGGVVAVRSAISRDRYRTEFINMEEGEMSRLTPGLLRAFDIVYLDARTWLALTTAERRALEVAVQEEGLGLLFGADLFSPRAGTPDAFQDGGLVASFQGDALEVQEQLLVRLALDGVPEGRTTPVPVAPFMLREAGGMVSLIRGESGEVVSGYRQQGAGRVGVSVVEETYRWVLEGSASTHAAYWTQLLSVLARADVAARWEVAQQGPVFQHEPVELQLSTQEERPVGLVGRVGAVPDTIALIQSQVEPSRWRGRYWPQAAGWYAVAMPEGEPLWFYVHTSSAWQSWQGVRNRRATRQAALSLAADTSDHSRVQRFSARPIPLAWFFGLFLVCCTALWVERKL